jgi:hypothetical protein
MLLRIQLIQKNIYIKQLALFRVTWTWSLSGRINIKNKFLYHNIIRISCLATCRRVDNSRGFRSSLPIDKIIVDTKYVIHLLSVISSKAWIWNMRERRKKSPAPYWHITEKDMSLERRYNPLITKGCLFWDIMGTNRAWKTVPDKRQNPATTCRIRSGRRCSYTIRILSSPPALFNENHMNVTNPVLNNEVKCTKFKPRKCSDIKQVVICKDRSDVKLHSLYTDCTNRNVPLFSNTLTTSI